MEKKTYLYPRTMRKACGYPYKFVIKSNSAVGNKYNYLLGVRTKDMSSRTTITKELYNAFINECKLNKIKFWRA
jgi:hypothetical protein